MNKSKKISPKDRFFSQDQGWELEGFSIEEISTIGNLNLLETTKLGLLCSVKCPAKIILKTQDYLKSMHGKATVISGFHSPVEKECLRILLREETAVIICPARSIDNLELPTAWEAQLGKGKLLVLSIFQTQHKRFDARLAYQRNKFVAVVADRMLIPFADKRSKTLELIRFMISKGKNVTAIDVRENAHLFGLGVKRV